jgi:hypothetical protein
MTNTHLQQKMLDLESNIQVLRTFKTMYKSAAEYKCSGCLRSFAPPLFKAHIHTCSKLVSTSDRQVDDRIFIKAVELLGPSSLRFYCSGYGLEWTATKDLSGLQTLVEGLRAKYPKALPLQENQVKRFLNISAGEREANDEEEVMALVNKVLAESMCVLYVVKTDRAFRDFFEIDDQLDNTPIATKRASGVVGAAVSQTHYVSFLSQAKR